MAACYGVGILPCDNIIVIRKMLTAERTWLTAPVEYLITALSFNGIQMKIPHSGLVQKKQLMGLHVRDIHHLGYIVEGRAKRIPHTVQTLLLLPVGIFLFPYDGLHLILPALLPYQDSPHTHGPKYQNSESPAGTVHLFLSILLRRCHGCIRQLEITLAEFKQLF